MRSGAHNYTQLFDLITRALKVLFVHRTHTRYTYYAYCIHDDMMYLRITVYVSI